VAGSVQGTEPDDQVAQGGQIAGAVAAAGGLELGAVAGGVGAAGEGVGGRACSSGPAPSAR